MITSVGIGAYLGGSALLTDDSILLVAAASMLTDEARHDAYLRTGLGASPIPSPFDTALSAVWAFNLAQMFVVSRPQQLPLIQLPKLNVTSPIPPTDLKPPVATGSTLTLAWGESEFLVPVA